MSARLPDRLLGLLTPQAYPHPVDSVELIETHISWVLLAGDFAYKIKRPVCYPFVDLRDPERRKYFCDEELRLNVRFAPTLYLEVCEVVDDAGRARIAAPGPGASGSFLPGAAARGPVLEHAVHMRRFPSGNELDRLVETRSAEPEELETFGRHLAMIHARLPAAGERTAWGQPSEVQALLVRNLAECADAVAIFGSASEVLALREPLDERLAAAAPWMAERRAAGCIRECHGDLHSRNVVRAEGRLVAFDCIEFEPAFRWIDVAEEVASLSSDLAARGRPMLAQAFRAGYLAQSGDYRACRLLRMYEAHRALVRAKIAALAAVGTEKAKREPLRREHVRLVAHAAASLRPGRPILLLMHGLSGSGKTWLARPLARRLWAVHLRSDVERKRRAGLAELARSGSSVARDLYSSETTAALYEHLARAAEDVLAGGYSVIVDATFLRREQRSAFSALARRLGVPLYVVCCTARADVLTTRLRSREQAKLDASEATGSVLEWQRAHLEALSPEEDIDAIRVDTANPRAPDEVVRRLGRESTEGEPASRESVRGEQGSE